MTDDSTGHRKPAFRLERYSTTIKRAKDELGGEEKSIRVNNYKEIEWIYE